MIFLGNLCIINNNKNGLGQINLNSAKQNKLAVGDDREDERIRVETK